MKTVPIISSEQAANMVRDEMYSSEVGLA